MPMAMAVLNVNDIQQGITHQHLLQAMMIGAGTVSSEHCTLIKMMTLTPLLSLLMHQQHHHHLLLHHPEDQHAKHQYYPGYLDARI
jgi:hypothetical protein